MQQIFEVDGEDRVVGGEEFDFHAAGTIFLLYHETSSLSWSRKEKSFSKGDLQDEMKTEAGLETATSHTMYV